MKTEILYSVAVLLFVLSNATAQITTLVPGLAIENPIAQGERHTCQVWIESGGYVYATVDQIGIDVVISVRDPDGKMINEVDGPTGAHGIENVTIEAGTSGFYQLEIHPFEAESYGEPPMTGKYEIEITERLTASEYNERRETIRTRHQETIKWISENAVPLKGVEAEQGFEDMQPLKHIIGDARLVALGEATHGTREFFQLKHRMLEFLVIEMGFTLFGIEASMPEGFDVNEYVLEGRGDPEKALAGLYFWTWNTEEVLEMIRWMRRYNADPNHTNKVKFYGFDMQSATRAMKVLADYLNRVDHNTSKMVRKNASLSLLFNPYTEQDFADVTGEEKQESLNIITSIIRDLEAHEGNYITRTDETDWEIALIHANILRQYILRKLPSDDFAAGLAVRDSSMAANIRWIMEHEGPDAKMVLWAHNGHVAYQRNRMGHFLRELFGTDMIVFGFTFNQGSFQAVELPMSSGRGLKPFDVNPLEDESLDATISAAGLPYGAIDLHGLPDSGYAAEWFSEPRNTRSIGAGFSHEAAPFFARVQRPTELYDALLFVDKTTAARPNPGGTRTGRRYLTSPENLDFETGEPGPIPEKWTAHTSRMANFDFTIETDTDNPQQGEKCVKIERKPGRHYGEMYGSLAQYVDATRYRGQQIELRAAVRTDVRGPGNQAYVWLNITKPEYGAQSSLFKDTMKDRPITTREWRFFEITADVPDDAQWIDFGMALSGEGTAWFDSFSLEIVDPKNN